MNQHESHQVTEQTGASAETTRPFQENADPDFEFEIQTRLGQIAREVSGLTGGDRLARALIELQGALADCDIAPIDEVPTLAPIQDLAGTAGAYRITDDPLVDPFTIEKSKVGTQFDVVRAIIAASVDRLRGDVRPTVQPFSEKIDELKSHALRLADEAYRLGFVDGRDSR